MADARKRFLTSDSTLFGDDVDDNWQPAPSYPLEPSAASTGASREPIRREARFTRSPSRDVRSPTAIGPHGSSSLRSVLRQDAYTGGLVPLDGHARASPGSGPSSIASPTLSGGFSSPKRRPTDEIDPFDNIFGTYRNDNNPPVTLRAPKRRRFLQDGQTDRFHNEDGWDVLDMIKQKYFRPSYNSLPEGHLRLLILHPGEDDDPIKVTLVNKPLNSQCRYEALSYVWGNDLPLKPIIVFDQTKPQMWHRDASKDKPKLKDLLDTKVSVVLIRANLKAAFMRLRQVPPKNQDGTVNWNRKNYWNPRYFRILWVDALCLDQRCIEEKSRELQRMDIIYGSALQVIVWLGEGNESSDNAMDFIEELYQDERAGRVTPLEPSKKTVDSFLGLMQCNWFGRRWIIQEIFFGNKPALYFGKKSHNIEKFYLALDRFMDMLHEQRNPRQRGPELHRSNMERVEAYGARVIHQLQSELLDKDDRDRPSRQKTLDFLICKLTAFDAGDPRDVIFGVHSLARRIDSTPLPSPNYKASVLDVFASFVEYSFRATWQLDVICRHWAPLDQAPFGPPSRKTLGRINGAPFVGDTTTLYNASKGIREEKIVAKFGKHRVPRVIREVWPSRARPRKLGRDILIESYDGRLEVQGVILGTITERSDRMIPEIIPRDVLHLGGWKYCNFDGANEVNDVPDQLWKTLIGNKHLNGTDADFGDKAACLAMLKEEDEHGDIRISDLLRRPYIFGNPKRNNYLERARVVCWNRRAFVGEQWPGESTVPPGNNELFGLGPDAIAEGDLICVIYGLSVPVILRAYENEPFLGYEEPPILYDPKYNPRRQPSMTPKERFLGYSATSTPSRRPSKSPLLQTSPTFSTSKSDSALPLAQTPLFPGNEPLYYKIIGEAYVNGMMEGQAIHNPRYKEQMFTLV